MDQKLLDNGLAIALVVTSVVVFVRFVLPWLKERAKASDEERRIANDRYITAMQAIADNARNDSRTALASFTQTIADRDRLYLADHERSNKIVADLVDVIKELKNKLP